MNVISDQKSAATSKVRKSTIRIHQFILNESNVKTRRWKFSKTVPLYISRSGGTLFGTKNLQKKKAEMWACTCKRSFYCRLDNVTRTAWWPTAVAPFKQKVNETTPDSRLVSLLCLSTQPFSDDDGSVKWQSWSADLVTSPGEWFNRNHGDVPCVSLLLDIGSYLEVLPMVIWSAVLQLRCQSNRLSISSGSRFFQHIK